MCSMCRTALVEQNSGVMQKEYISANPLRVAVYVYVYVFM